MVSVPWLALPHFFYIMDKLKLLSPQEAIVGIPGWKFTVACLHFGIYCYFKFHHVFKLAASLGRQQKKNTLHLITF